MPAVVASTAAEQETHRPSPRSPAAVPAIYRNRWMGLVVVVGVSALAGWLTALTMPRGPITAGGVAVAMAVGFGVGGVAGLALRSRWAILLAPVVFVAACEIGRVGVIGPTVDRPDFSTTFGILVLVLGRVVQGVAQLLPMMVGAATGAAIARRVGTGRPDCHGWRHASLWGRRGVTVGLTVALVGFAVLMTRPGTTEQIADIDGGPVADSVAEFARVSLGGHQQTPRPKHRQPGAALSSRWARAE